MSVCFSLTVILLAILHVQSQSFKFEVQIDKKPMMITISSSSSRPKLVKICLGEGIMANINYMNGYVYKIASRARIEISLIEPQQQTISVDFGTEDEAKRFMESYKTCKLHSKVEKKKKKGIKIFEPGNSNNPQLSIIQDINEKPNTNTNKKSTSKTIDTAGAFKKNAKTQWEREKQTPQFKQISTHQQLVKMKYKEVLGLVYKSMIKSKKKYDRKEMDKMYEQMKNNVDFAQFMDGDVADSEFSDDYGNYDGQDLYDDEDYYTYNYVEDILDEMYMEGFKSGLSVANRLKSNSVKKTKKRYNYYNMY